MLLLLFALLYPKPQPSRYHTILKFWFHSVVPHQHQTAKIPYIFISSFFLLSIRVASENV